MTSQFTERVARYLAECDESGDYIAKRCRNGTWCVWSQAADHYVEFDQLGNGCIIEQTSKA